MSTLRNVAAVALAGAVVLTGCADGVPTTEASAPATSESDVEDDGDTREPEEGAADLPADLETGDESDDRAIVEPFITFAGPGADPGTIEVDGFLPEVIEEGGVCTAEVRGTTFASSAPAVSDATTTTCGAIVLPVAPNGQTVELSYSSATSRGTSEPVTVTS